MIVNAPRLVIVAGLAGAAFVSAATAQQPTMEDLKQAPPARQVTSVSYCRGQYTVGLADGSSRTFGERDLRFATDSSPMGPVAGRAVLVPTGRVGDRAIVVFVGPGEMAAAVRTDC